MGIVIAGIVIMVGIFSLHFSISMVVSSYREAKNAEKVDNFILLLIILSPVVCLGVYYFPVDYGESGNNYDLVINILSIKTASFILAPGVIAKILANLYIKRRKDGI